MVERETIVERQGSSPVLAAIGGIVVLLLVIGLVWFLFFNNGEGGSGSVDVDVPEVSVDVTPDGA